MPQTLAVMVSDIFALGLGVILVVIALGVGFFLVFHAITGRKPGAPRPQEPRASIHDLTASSRQDDKS